MEIGNTAVQTLMAVDLAVADFRHLENAPMLVRLEIRTGEPSAER